MELGDDVVDAGEYNHDRILTHLGQDIQVKDDALFGGIGQSNSDNCIDYLRQINLITGTVLKSFKQLECSFSHGQTIVYLVLERTQVDLLDQLCSDSSL